MLTLLAIACFTFGVPLLLIDGAAGVVWLTAGLGFLAWSRFRSF